MDIVMVKMIEGALEDIRFQKIRILKRGQVEVHGE